MLKNFNPFAQITPIYFGCLTDETRVLNSQERPIIINIKTYTENKSQQNIKKFKFILKYEVKKIFNNIFIFKLKHKNTYKYFY